MLDIPDCVYMVYLQWRSSGWTVQVTEKDLICRNSRCKIYAYIWSVLYTNPNPQPATKPHSPRLKKRTRKNQSSHIILVGCGWHSLATQTVELMYPGQEQVTNDFTTIRNSLTFDLPIHNYERETVKYWLSWIIQTESTRFICIEDHQVNRSDYIKWLNMYKVKVQEYIIYSINIIYFLIEKQVTNIGDIGHHISHWSSNINTTNIISFKWNVRQASNSLWQLVYSTRTRLKLCHFSWISIILMSLSIP